MPQSTATRGWDSRLVQAAITEATRSNPSVNAPTTTAPPAGQSLAEPAEPVRKKKHGWSIEGQARPTGPDALPSASPTAPLPAPHTPAYTDPGMSHSSRAPAALGAPLGEESFPPMGPPPLPVREREYVDPLSALTESDWSSLPGSSATEADVWSVTSAAPL